jgi:acyl carrier protein
MNDAKFTRAEMCDWMVGYLAQLLELQRHEIDPSKSFELYGLDSSGAVGMSGDLEEMLGAEFETSLVYDYPTIDSLLDHLVSLNLLRAA